MVVVVVVQVGGGGSGGGCGGCGGQRSVVNGRWSANLATQSRRRGTAHTIRPKRDAESSRRSYAPNYAMNIEIAAVLKRMLCNTEDRKTSLRNGSCVCVCVCWGGGGGKGIGRM